MSSTIPPGDPSQPERLQLGTGDPIHEEPERRGKGRRVALVGGGLAVVLLAGGGAWAWNAWFNQGPQPSKALPADTLGYVSIDVDPTGQQKVEAIGFLRKFPAFKDEIGLDTDDDVRKKVFELIQEDGTCADLDYADDVEPWLGHRAAFGVVPRGEDEPVPVAVLQVTDEAKAEGGLKALSECDSGSTDAAGGYAVANGWAVLADSEQIATAVAEDAQEASLADDGDFQQWTGAAGDPGVITMYAAPEAGEALLDFGGGDLMGMGSSSMEDSSAATAPAPGEIDNLNAIIADLEAQIAETPESQRAPLEEQLQMFEQMRDDMQASEQPTTEAAESSGDSGEESEASDEVPDEVRKALEDFPGMAGTVRFDDDDLEIELASGQLDSAMASLVDSDRGGETVATLPDSTAVALGLAFGEGWAQALLDQVAPMIEAESGMSMEDAIAQAEAETGLAIPEDVETLLGESVALSLDSSVDFEDFAGGDPSGAPVGLKIKGDAEEIEKVLDKIRAKMGPAAELLVSESEGDHVLVGMDPDYVTKLAGDGGLGDADAFSDVVPEAEGSSAVFFLDFDADNWLDDLVGSFTDDDELVANIKPLQALGVSSWLDGDESHALVKVSTD